MTDILGPDPKNIIMHSRENCSQLPVTTARYTVVFVMNEEDPNASDEDHRGALTAEIQRVMNEADFTTTLRYDAVSFTVVAREVLDVAPPNEREDDDA